MEDAQAKTKAELERLRAHLVESHEQQAAQELEMEQELSHYRQQMEQLQQEQHAYRQNADQDRSMQHALTDEVQLLQEEKQKLLAMIARQDEQIQDQTVAIGNLEEVLAEEELGRPKAKASCITRCFDSRRPI